MFRFIFILFFVWLIIFSDAVFAQSEKCQQNIFLSGTINPLKKRGLNAHIKKNFEAGRVTFLPSENLDKKHNSVATCSISFLNVSDQKTHIYIDSVYCGSINAGGIGLIEIEKGYSNVYCLTDDSKISWFGKGGCDCKYIFHLK